MTALLSRRLSLVIPSLAALALGVGWASREVVFAQEKVKAVASQTVTLDQVKMSPYEYEGKKVGDVGIYVNGDTPGSTKFVTGRFIVAPGQTPHAPHVHAEEEVMVIESGQGEIFNDGKPRSLRCPGSSRPLRP